MPRSYQKLFRQKVVMTTWGNGKALPLGLKVSGDDFSTFAILFPIFYVIDNFTPIGMLVNLMMNKWLFILGGAIGVTVLAGKLDPAGKPLLKYLWDALRYFFRVHVTNGWDKIPRAVARKRGRKTVIKLQAKQSWTNTNVPLPAIVKGKGRFEFQNGMHVDVLMKRTRTKFRKARKLGFRSKYKSFGVRPGIYSIGARQMKRIGNAFDVLENEN